MKRIVVSTLIIVLCLGISAEASKNPDKLLEDAVLVFKEIAGEPDSEQMQSILKKAYGVAIFPSVVKVGFGLGGRYGEGLILRYDPVKKTWYGPFFVQIKGLSYGLQIGLQSTSLVLVITTERGMENLEKGKITLGGSMSVAVGPMGRSAEAGTDLKFEAAIYSYSLSKGVFAGASLEGATIDNNVNANQIYWNKELDSTEILNRRASGKAIHNLIKELNAAVK
ncbi:MAG: lipid-binding SYLF domain-containing protein [Bacillota bacterium]|nr:lipid-binding SYLF domain-containing protein [Bacillota bacterium]